MRFVVLIFALIIIILIRIALNFIDKAQLSEYFAAKGNVIYDIKWNAGFMFLDRNERHYTVRYYDKEKNLHVCICKTSMFGGVYCKEDYIVIENKVE